MRSRTTCGGTARCTGVCSTRWRACTAPCWMPAAAPAACWRVSAQRVRTCSWWAWSGPIRRAGVPPRSPARHWCAAPSMRYRSGMPASMPRYRPTCCAIAPLSRASALAELRRVLRPGGRLVINMPAYMWLASAHDRQVHNARRYTAGQLRSMLLAAGFHRLRVGYWNSLLLPLMIAQRKLLDARHRRLGCRLVSAMAGCHVTWHDRNRVSPAVPPACRRIGAGDRGATMNHAIDLLAPLSVARAEAEPALTPGIGLSIVIPVYRGAATIGCLVDTLSQLHPDGGLEIVLVNDGSPDNSDEVCQRAASPRDRAADLCRARPQLRRAQRRHDRTAACARRLRDHHGRRSAEPAGGGAAAVRPCAVRQLGRGLHALWHQAARRLAQSRQPVRQLRGRSCCWTSRRGCICPRSAACRRWWCGQ